MRTHLLSAGMLLLVSAYSFGQFGISNDDAVENLETPSTEVLNFNSLPSNGRVTGYLTNSRIRYNASLKDARFHGEWKSWYDNNIVRDEGILKKGLPDGEWKVFHSNGNLRHLRTYSSDKYYRITQEWKRPHPKFVRYGLTDLYLKNKRDAVAVTKRSYSFKRTDTDYVPVFSSGLLHGTYMNFSQNGKTKDSGLYENGLRSGVWIETNEIDNTVMTGAYKNSQRIGTWKLMTANRKLLAVIHYKNGREDWRKSF